MRRRPRWPWQRPPEDDEREASEGTEPERPDPARPDPARATRPEGPAGFHWEGLGLAPERRGPKGYRRADVRVHDEVCARLTDDSRVDASAIEVSVEEGVVTLRGMVADRAQKRRAERIAEHAHGVEDVMNELRIRRERPAERQALPSSNGGGRG
jgi:hypothetical protein